MARRTQQHQQKPAPMPRAVPRAVPRTKPPKRQEKMLRAQIQQKVIELWELGLTVEETVRQLNLYPEDVNHIIREHISLRSGAKAPQDSPQSPTTLEEKVKRRKVTHTSEEIEFSVALQPNVYEPLLRFLKERGLTGSEFIQLSLRAALNKSGFYSLSDQLRFGKYYGEKMETVIRADPEYIDWCMSALKNFCLDNACVTLLSEIRPDLTRKRNSEPPDVSDP